MIQKESKLNVADNTGAKKARCISIPGGSRKRYASIGDVIKVSVAQATPGGMVQKGELMDAVIVRTSKEFRRDDGSYIRFDDNAAVLIDENQEPLGTRIFGPITRELRNKNYMRIVSMAPEVL